MNEAQVRKYFIKYGLCLAAAHFGLTFCSISLLLEWKIGRMDRGNKALQKTVKNMEYANDTFRSILRMERMKEDYNRQGIKATED